MKAKTYLMKDNSTGYYKIGKSIKPEVREKTLQSEKPSILMIAQCLFDIESELHSKFSLKRVRGEWFMLDDNDIDFLIDVYSKISLAEIRKIILQYNPRYNDNVTISPYRLQKMIDDAVDRKIKGVVELLKEMEQKSTLEVSAKNKTYDSNFLTVEEAAEKYHVDRSTLFRWRQNGKISAIKISRKKILFDKEKLSKELEILTGRIMY